VITVCNAGRVSQTAAAILADRGFDARSLVGGMKAWSLAWNTAEIPLEDSTVRVVQVRRTGKGCLAYVVGSGDEAAVIDPSLPTEIYVDLARRHGWDVRYVLETHIHADHLSRAKELASQTGAVLLLPTQGRARFPFTALAEGDRIRIGNATITAIHTPGHTGESTSYVLNAAAVFTGDSVFTNGVGRPDLHANAEAGRHRARALFHSLLRLLELPSNMLVLPAHTSEPIAFDEQPVCASVREVARWLSAWLTSESGFVERVTSKLPPTPPNFVRIVELNESGNIPDIDPTDLEAGANRCAVK
jgi:glyoxylase-like metal-dependent hydrolase (beta-lactamase superfamily II)